MVSLFGRDLISIADLTKSEILEVLRRAAALKRQPAPNALAGKSLATLFFESSTRTRLSFQTAMKRLGGTVIGVTDKGSTTTSKGESLADAVRIIGQYVDALVIRHPLEGSARRAAEATDKPVINAGDGANQHPTQTLLDLFSIQETQKKLTGLSVALGGDLKYGRTVHSLVRVLASHFSPRLFFVAPEMLQIPAEYQRMLEQHRVRFSLHDRIEEVVRKVDIFYMTRIQRERFPDPLEYEKVKDTICLRQAHLDEVKKNLKILHPLPRVNELEQSVDQTPYAYYFQQAENGLYVREALLMMMLKKSGAKAKLSNGAELRF